MTDENKKQPEPENPGHGEEGHVHGPHCNHHHHQEPYVRQSPKVGRNDPCICGSGKKYKKCCAKAS